MQKWLTSIFMILMFGLQVNPAVGDSATGQPAPAAYDWHRIASPTSADLFDIDMTSPSDGWIASADGSLLHWDGARWNSVLGTPGTPLTAVSVISETLGWAVGDAILSWDGNVWSPYDHPLNKYLSDVKILSPTEGWAVGYAGRILNWDGVDWSTRLSTQSEWFRAVDGLANDDMWAVYGTSAPQVYGGIVHWDGLLWSDVLTGTTSLLDIEILDQDNGWAVGFNRQIYRWDGLGWQPASSQVPVTGGPLWAVSAISGQDAWAAGADGLLTHWDGSAWKVAPGPLLDPDLDQILFYGIKMLASDDVWLVGSQGRIYHYRPLHAYLPLISNGEN